MIDRAAIHGRYLGRRELPYLGEMHAFVAAGPRSLGAARQALQYLARQNAKGAQRLSRRVF